MNKMVKRELAILNLAGKLTPELAEYFSRKNILLVDPLEVETRYEWTHILTKDVSDFSEIEETYRTLEHDIRIISLTPVDDIQHFVLSNGKLIFDEIWMKNKLGDFILDKFLQEFGGIALGDSYPTFKETGSFNIANPFNTGEYLDRMVFNAFNDGISALSIKTYFDHLLMYLTGLKTLGKLGLPIEVTYGYFEEVFGVQLHFFTKDLILEDVTFSLSSQISKKAEKYLLNIAVQACDFFDFTLLKDVNKTVITALWTKDERIKIENRGILFNELTAAAPITHYPSEGVTSFQVNSPTLEDLSDKVVLSGSSQEDNFSQTVKGMASEKGESSQTIHGEKEEEELSQLIKGQKEEEEHSQTIKGQKEEEELINIIKGKIEEEEQVFKIAGSKNFDVDKFAIRISSGVEEKAKDKDILKIQSLPDAIKTGLFDFTNKLNKSIENISEEDLQNFKNNEVPKIIKKTIGNTVASRSHEAAITKENEKILDLKLKAVQAENENLKSKIKTLMTEVKIIKDSKTQLAEIHHKAVQAAAEATNTQPSINPDTALREQFLQKLQDQKILNDHDSKKLAMLLERETKFLKDAKEDEIKLKKLQIESTQKESFFTQEVEKLQRQMKAKDLVVIKAKESLTKLVEQKDKEINGLNEKINQLTKTLSSNNSQNQALQIRELERQVVNHEKMIEIYKNKMIQKPVARVEDDASKEENRRLQMLNNQLKNQFEMAKKDLMKAQERLSQDASLMNGLKADKIKLEQALKKAALDAKKEESNPVIHQQEQEIKRLQSQNDLLENQLKDAQNRHKEMEAKLADALKNQKKDIATDDPSKGKMAHLEGNVRKLTQDLVESRNQLADMKKETNKLRQEKTALQNQLDKMKKEADKAKSAAPKKPGSGNSGAKAA